MNALKPFPDTGRPSATTAGRDVAASNPNDIADDGERVMKSKSTSSRALRQVAGATLLLIMSCPQQDARAGTADLWDTRVSIQDECPVTGKEQLPQERALVPVLATAGLSLFQALLPKAIDVGLTYAASEAKKSAREDNSIIEAAGLGWVDGFYEMDLGRGTTSEVASWLANKCLVVSRGLYASSEVAATFTQRPWKDKDVEARLFKLGLKRDPGIYLEARFRVSPDGTHFRVEPIRFFFDRALHDGTQPTQEFDLAFEFKFQTPSSEGRGASFALGNLILRGVIKGEHLKEEALVVSSTGWMPILPRTPEIASVSERVTALYAARDRLKKEASETEQELGELSAAWAPQSGAPQNGSRTKLFKSVGDEAERELANEDLDDAVFEAMLKTPTAADGGEPRELTELDRARRVLAHSRRKSELRNRKEKADRALERLALAEIRRMDLEAVEAQIAELESKPLVFAPVNIVVSIKEQISKPENRFLMTAAEILEGSHEAVRDVITANLTPAGREQQRKEQVEEIAERASLVMAAMETKRLADEKDLAWKALPSAASPLDKVNAKSALEQARVQANIAALRAGLTPPFKEAFGGAQ